MIWPGTIPALSDTLFKSLEPALLLCGGPLISLLLVKQAYRRCNVLVLMQLTRFWIRLLLSISAGTEAGMNMFVLIFLNMMKTGWPYYLNVVSLVICVRLFLQFLVMMAQFWPMQRPCAIGIPGFSSAAFAAVRLPPARLAIHGTAAIRTAPPLISRAQIQQLLSPLPLKTNFCSGASRYGHRACCLCSPDLLNQEKH